MKVYLRLQTLWLHSNKTHLKKLWTSLVPDQKVQSFWVDKTEQKRQIDLLELRKEGNGKGSVRMRKERERKKDEENRERERE